MGTQPGREQIEDWSSVLGKYCSYQISSGVQRNPTDVIEFDMVCGDLTFTHANIQLPPPLLSL